ncbi:murein biosynthesis integral membrane protein MurJ [Amnibacterium flavum]|uniref:Murein biosynthesis integral membrane protein MurJ n=1 Tax=Amnibacterium flavum TaxID=2173173 RepID=A0A2V1HT11_9MICO|nr:murein biosynthesis integral membrane protein MurJ [Amnibacterium flavum]PVZ95471.1 murein biosynthesis integral membrane protein MurJ [Amnibacterium flavum]
MSGIGRASAFLASGTIVSRVLGFVKIFVLAQAVGAVGSVSGDAFASATMIPNSIYAIIGGGLLSAILVPQIVRASGGPDGGSAYINKLVTLALVAFLVVTVAATLAAPALVSLYGPKSAALATAFAYWCIPQVFFLGLYALLGEVLNARRLFGPFTWAPVANNIVGVAATLVFIGVFGADASGTRTPADWTPGMIALLAGGATLGIAVQAVLLFFFWRRIGLTYRPDFAWRGVGLGAAGTAAGWTLAMLVATQIAGLIETRVANIASGQGASVLTLSTAWLIFMLPHSIITVSVVTAFYTRMSEHAAQNDMAAFRRDIAATLRTVSLLLVLASAVIAVVAIPFSRVFTPEYADVQQMAGVVIAYGVGLVPFSLLFVVQRGFYALGDTRTPFVFTIAQVVIVIAGVLGCALLPVDMIAMGIAAVVSGATLIQLLIAAVLLARKIGWAAAGLPRSLSTDIVATVPAAIVGYFVLLGLGGLTAGGFAVDSVVGAIVSMIAIGAAMGVVYLLLLWLLRSPDLRLAIDIVARRRRP